MHLKRRQFLTTSASGAAGLLLSQNRSHALGIPMREVPRGERPEQSPEVEVLNPRGRVPTSFIIDDSTCLVNMGHFCMPQFAAAYPGRKDYLKPWRDWPREIPDAFVRKFGEWCRGQGVKGKYSVVPYPACVGWVDRFIPGWSKAQLRDSLKLVRDFMAPDWDIHPEMISHTRVLNLKTGRPFAEINKHTMENSHPAEPVSVDYLAEYISFALQILKNADLPCEGFTTPGGFGNLVKSELSLAAIDALRATYDVEVPHYFKYLETGDASTQPQVEHASGLATDAPKCAVNVIAGTGDWFGGWDGVGAGDIDESADRFITADFKKGRIVEMIERDEPAIMLCHWPGIYCNGEEDGFKIFQKAVSRLNEGYGDRVAWMKLSEIARYWAAKELTSIKRTKSAVELNAPFAAPDYTLRFKMAAKRAPKVVVGLGRKPLPLKEAKTLKELTAGTWLRDGESVVVCFDLPKGTTRVL
jgi:hypothetical protein